MTDFLMNFMNNSITLQTMTSGFWGRIFAVLFLVAGFWVFVRLRNRKAGGILVVLSVVCAFASAGLKVVNFFLGGS